NDVFEYFYISFLIEMINDIQIFFNVDYLTIGDLSEGEKKLLLLKSAFEFVAQEDSLFMLEEPDSHIHLDND
ncbi:ATP-binding protein, partial [Francisella tularensis subsp. holarctica]|uniref:AAA family ATPase n=1 Tax=Francisella tularensis TaxID=263 RepID=UPI0023AB7B79|nr:ATP-binding protein [Francisella tularensis subsp. holarctica]